jgi:hypothetical protein
VLGGAAALPEAVAAMTGALPDLAAAALELAAAEWAVFPLRARDKRPLRACRDCWQSGCRAPADCGHQLCHGVLDATIDLAAVTRWWAQRPQANIGARVPAGCIVLDIDPRHGGDAALAELEARWGPLPTTVRVRTGSGGWHYYFRCRVKVSQSRLPRGVEIKTPAGYCVMPPSVHPDTGARYEWACVDPIPPSPPGWLGDLIRVKTVTNTRPASTGTTAFSASPGIDRGPIPDGARHRELVSLAGWLRSAGFDWDDAVRFYRTRWEACAQPPAARWPLSWDDALSKLEDIYSRYPAGR